LGIIKSILSGSSLGHFQDKNDIIEESLAELARVLMPGGTLVIIFDNRHNPIVWLRNRLLFNWLSCLRLAPQYLGVTYNRSEVDQNLKSLGFAVTDMTAVAHACILAIWFVVL
jgi:SAM-dependent methyltransferase